jgi:hypothetical protein
MIDQAADQLAARRAAETRAFLGAEEAVFGDITLRPVSLASLALLEETRNEFLHPQGPLQTVPHPVTCELLQLPTMANETFAVAAFAFIHGAPISAVRRVAFSPALFREAVLEFSEQIQPSHLPGLTAEITDRLQAVTRLQFDIAPKPEKPGKGGRKAPDPPGNFSSQEG